MLRAAAGTGKREKERERSWRGRKEVKLRINEFAYHVA